MLVQSFAEGQDASEAEGWLAMILGTGAMKNNNRLFLRHPEPSSCFVSAC